MTGFSPSSDSDPVHFGVERGDGEIDLAAERQPPNIRRRWVGMVSQVASKTHSPVAASSSAPGGEGEGRRAP